MGSGLGQPGIMGVNHPGYRDRSIVPSAEPLFIIVISRFEYGARSPVLRIAGFLPWGWYSPRCRGFSRSSIRRCCGDHRPATG